MTPLPNAESELMALERFLAIELTDVEEANKAIQDMRQRAKRLALRITNPVRVGIVGLPGAGKSSLAAFLGGFAFQPVATPDGRRLPIILRYGQPGESRAGWWSGVEVPQTGIDIPAAAELKPDYLELRLPNPVLQAISFLDLPGAHDWASQKEQMHWISNRADLLLWCTNAKDPWLDDEWQLWSLVPRRLQERSILVATHVDEASAGDEPVQTKLERRLKGLFRGVVGIATPDALAAAPGGEVSDAAAWAKAGGRAMVGLLVRAARAKREADIEAARDVATKGRELLDAPKPSFQQHSVQPPRDEPPAEAEAPQPPQPKRDESPSIPPSAGAPSGPDAAPPKPQRKDAAPKVTLPASKEVEAAPSTPAASALASALGDAAKSASEKGAGGQGKKIGLAARLKAGTRQKDRAVAEPESPATQEIGAGLKREVAPDLPPGIQDDQARADAPKASENPAVAESTKPKIRSNLSREAQPLLALLDERLADLSTYLQQPGAKDWEFMAKVTDLGDALSLGINEPGALAPGSEWVRREVEDAFVALSLLQMEPGEGPCADAATILLQLAHDLSWASRNQEAQSGD